MGRQPKYRNIREKGFDSRREARRYAELQLLQKAGEITDLERQVRFEVIPKTGLFRAAHYVADFVYRDDRGEVVVEDAKGYETSESKLKRKLMYHVHKINVILV